MRGVIWFAVLVHATWGVLLLVLPAPQGVTAIHELTRLCSDHHALGALLLLVAVAAAYGCRHRESMIGLYVLLPQQFLLMLSALGAVRATWLGQFADGVDRPHAFIGADQAPAVITAVLHTLAIIQLHLPGLWEKLRPQRA